MRFALALGLGYTLFAQFANNLLKNNESDSTIFAYAGQLVRQGLLPYRDFWDNKPPLIFYTEALAYALF